MISEIVMLQFLIHPQNVQMENRVGRDEIVLFFFSYREHVLRLKMLSAARPIKGQPVEG